MRVVKSQVQTSCFCNVNPFSATKLAEYTNKRPNTLRHMSVCQIDRV